MLHSGNAGIFCLTALMQQKWYKGSKWWQEARICSGHIPSEGFLNIATLWASCLISLVLPFPQVTSWADFRDTKPEAGQLKLNSHGWGLTKGTAPYKFYVAFITNSVLVLHVSCSFSTQHYDGSTDKLQLTQISQAKGRSQIHCPPLFYYCYYYF